MKSTYDPNQIYEAFDRYGFTVLRIDQFDRGDYAEIRTELGIDDFLSVKHLFEVSRKLELLEKNEGVELHIIHIDMRHKTLKVHLHIKPDTHDIKISNIDENKETESILNKKMTELDVDGEVSNASKGTNSAEQNDIKESIPKQKSKAGIILDIKTKPSSSS